MVNAEKWGAKINCGRCQFAIA